MNKRQKWRGSTAVLIGVGVVAASVITAIKVSSGVAAHSAGADELAAVANRNDDEPRAFERWDMTWWPMERTAPEITATVDDSDLAAARDQPAGYAQARANMRLRRQGLRDDPPLDSVRGPILWHEPLARSEVRGFPLDGDGTWPTAVVDALRQVRAAQFEQLTRRTDGWAVAAVDLDRGLRLGYLPGGLEVYTYEFQTHIQGNRCAAYVVYDPKRYAVTAQPFVAGPAPTGPRPHLAAAVNADRITDLDGDGTAELVIRQHHHNGTVDDYDVDRYLEIAADGSLTEVLTLSQNAVVSGVSEFDAGMVYRRVHPLGPNALMVTVRFENPRAGVGPRRLGRILLEREGRGHRFRPVGRYFDSPIQAHRVVVGP